MTNSFIVTIAGTPRPQPRPRFIRGRAVSTANAKVQLWRHAIQRGLNDVLDGRERPIFYGAVRVTLTFSFFTKDAAMIGQSIPKRADVDNLSKPVLDVMESCRVFANDRQVAELEVFKLWGSSPSLVIEVLPLDLARPRRRFGGISNRPDWL